MKVYSIPAGIKIPQITDHLANFATYDQACNKFIAELKDWAIRNGYQGENTGREVSFPVADGFARYMIIERAPRTMALVHLPLGDAWHYQYVEYLSKKEILQNATRNEALVSIFARKAG